MHCFICQQTFHEKVTWKFVFGFTSGELICEVCSEKLVEISGEICEKCGRSFANLDRQYRIANLCSDCSRWQSNALEKNRSVYVYNDFLQEVMATWKYRGDAELTKLFWAPLQKLANEFPADVIVPIPLNESRLYERSFNQAKLLAEGLTLPIVEALQRPKEALKQSKKTRKQRLDQEGQIEKFQITTALRNEIQGKKALLIDDIYTTGATLYAAATVLKTNGVTNVYAITIARG